MANYADSVLAKAQVMLDQRFNQAEMRAKPSSTFMTLLKNTQFLIPDARMLRTREDRPVHAYLKNRASRAAGSARTHNHTGSVADSTEVDILFTTYEDSFATSLKRADYNVFNDAEILSHEIENALINLHESIESDLVTWLDTNKTTVSNPPSGALQRANFNAGVFEIAGEDSQEFWSIIGSVFAQHKYSGQQFDVISGSRKFSEGKFLAQQGQGNQTNLGWQFAGLNVAESIEVYDAAYSLGLVYAMPVGMTGILDWIPRQNREGKGDYESVLGGYGTIIDPMTGLSIAVHAYSERADTSSVNGNGQDVVTQWELSIDLSPQLAPISTANESVIYAFGQVA